MTSSQSSGANPLLALLRGTFDQLFTFAESLGEPAASTPGRLIFPEVAVASAVVELAPGQGVCGHCNERVESPPDFPLTLSYATCSSCRTHFWAVTLLDGAPFIPDKPALVAADWNLTFLGTVLRQSSDSTVHYRLSQLWVGSELKPVDTR